MKKTYSDNEIQSINFVNRPSLYEAVKQGNVNQVKKLVEKHGDVLLQPYQAWSALHQAAVSVKSATNINNKLDIANLGKFLPLLPLLHHENL